VAVLFFVLLLLLFSLVSGVPFSLVSGVLISLVSGVSNFLVPTKLQFLSESTGGTIARKLALPVCIRVIFTTGQSMYLLCFWMLPSKESRVK
jgi:hypothetical protein